MAEFQLLVANVTAILVVLLGATLAAKLIVKIVRGFVDFLNSL
jgi:hypothetical protein